MFFFILMNILVAVCTVQGHWVERGGSPLEYEFVPTALTCNEAQRYCEEQLGSLASVEDEQDLVYLKGESQKQFGSKHKVTIGLRKEAGRSRFNWLSGSNSTFTSWRHHVTMLNPLPENRCYCTYADFQSDSSNNWMISDCGSACDRYAFVCQRPKDLCSSARIQINCIARGGSCVETGNEATCTCPPGRTGRYCEDCVHEMEEYGSFEKTTEGHPDRLKFEADSWFPGSLETAIVGLGGTLSMILLIIGLCICRRKQKSQENQKSRQVDQRIEQDV